MGAGPEALIAGGLPDALRRAGHGVDRTVVEAPEGAEGDPVASAFALARRIAGAAADARASGRLPIVLAGNCINTVGAVAGVNGSDLGLVWFDAHGDLNTPETSTSGFLDGMSVATLLGWCYVEEAAALPGFAPLDAARVLFVGVRDLDPPEVAAAERAGIRMLAPPDAAVDAALGRALDAFAAGVRRVYVHLDLDVLDPAAHGRANPFAAPGGLTAAGVQRAVRAMGARGRIAGLTVSAYDPAVDAAGTVRAAAIRLIADAIPAGSAAA
jgi:arginase